MSVIGSWTGHSDDAHGEHLAVSLTVQRTPSVLLIDALLGDTQLKFSLQSNRLHGELPGLGRLELEQLDDYRFRSVTPPDSAGEFQIQLDWQFIASAWIWRFSTGLPGTRHKGAELTWELKGQSDELIE